MTSAADMFDDCPYCGEPAPCEPCQRNAERAGTSRRDSSLDVVLPVDEDGPDRVAQMLRERGYDPDEWVVQSMTVNEWESPRAQDQGIRLLRQTKAHLTRVIPDEETPWGRLAMAIQEATADSFPKGARRELKPIDGPRTVVLIGDEQAPHVNWALHEASLEAIRDIAPDMIIGMGDTIDFDSISRYDVKHPEWQSSVNQGIGVAGRIIRERLEVAPDVVYRFLSGNHEIRLQNFLLNKAPALFGIKAADTPEHAPDLLSIDNLLGLGRNGIEYVMSAVGDYPHPMTEIAAQSDTAPAFLCAHGWKVKKGGGASAQASVDDMNASLATGHTHRLAATHVTRWTQNDPVQYDAVETGAMCDPVGLGYAKFPDWQPGFAVVHVYPDSTTSVALARWNHQTKTLTLGDSRWQITATGVRRSQ